MLLGGIEAGGTKMVCAIGDEEGKILDRYVLPTKEPDETLSEMISYFKRYEIEALGIATFGPVDLVKNSDTYGFITRTPKPGWDFVDFITPFKTSINVPIGFDTDVNGAILGEVYHGAAKGLDSSIYITVGTGIGVGVYVNNSLLHGMGHPEGGHIIMSRYPGDDFKCNCSFHESCFEGLAAGPAIEKRYGKTGKELYDRSEVWELEAFYIAQAIADYVFLYSPERIIIGGGVMHNETLYPLIRKKVLEFLNEYVIIENIDSYIVKPGLGDNAGIVGALQLGYLALKDLEAI